VGIHAVDGQQGDQQSGGEPQPEAHHNEDQQELQDILVKDAPQEALQFLAIQVGDQQERDNSVALGLQHDQQEGADHTAQLHVLGEAPQRRSGGHSQMGRQPQDSRGRTYLPVDHN